MTARSDEGSIFGLAKKVGDNYAPEIVYESVRKSILVFKNRDKFYREKVVYPLYSLGFADFNSLYTEEYYSERTEGEKVEVAEKFHELISEEFSPESVFDVGCAIGHFLQPFHENGVEVHGVDAHPSSREHSVIPESKIDIQDLTEGYNSPDKVFDLVLCLETLEHIPESSEDKVVELIAGLGELLVISAATPDQGGMHHVNEKPKSYWINRFEKKGFSFDSETTQKFKSAIELEDERKDNLLIFEREEEVAGSQ